ncbi:Scr1 family TA system antitoxin-like transcriptional regulator [Streptomyces cellulosae]
MTAVEAESGGVEDEMDEPGWDVDPDDEWGVAVITTVGRQVKLRREAAGLRVPDFGRALGGRAAWQGQLQRLLDVAQLHHVVLQVMPTDCETHSGLDGRIELLKFDDGTAMGRSDGAFNGRPTSDPPSPPTRGRVSFLTCSGAERTTTPEGGRSRSRGRVSRGGLRQRLTPWARRKFTGLTAEP